MINPRKSIISPIQALQSQSNRDALLLRIASDLLKIHAQFIDKVDKLNKRGDKGEKGDRGEKGLTGDIGRMPTRQEIESVLIPLAEKVAKGAVPTREDFISIIKPLIPTIESKELVITEEHINLIANKVSKKVKKGEVKVNEIDPLAIIDQIMALPDGKRLSTKHIDGLEQTISAMQTQLRHGYLHGGGDSVVAGTGIAITTNAAGKKVITNTGIAATWYQDEVPSGTKNGVNVTFTLAHTPASVVFLYLNGQYLVSGGSDYSRSGTTITMVTAPLSTDTLICTYS